ncbi:hypothetical protein ABZ897_57895 [Nonomuraea sp. NPDC046802]|uniref:hypothetical protein n=1 Tax=Nonomuraea sp. NPDC046802 TaxID=3154919 RepID=UPI0033D30B4C
MSGLVPPSSGPDDIAPRLSSPVIAGLPPDILGRWGLSEPADAGAARPVGPGAGGGAMAATVARICRRLAAPARPQVTVLERGGVRVDLRGELDEPRRWVVGHQLLRELSLVGWHVTVDDTRLLVLGWSAAQLAYRLRVLQLALTSLEHVGSTIDVAVAVADQQRHRCPDLPWEELSASVLDHVEREHLRWPIRLAEMDGLERTSPQAGLRHQLRTSIRLEEQVRAACSWHVHVAGLAIAAWQHRSEHARSGPQTREAAITHIRSMRLTELLPPGSLSPTPPETA